VLAALALWSLHRALYAVPLPAITAIAAEIPRFRIWAALLLTVVCYTVLFGYDALALRYVRRRLQLHRTALASFIAYAFSQNLGFSVLAGASVRCRFWSGWGLSAGEIAQGIAFTSISFWLGVLGVGGCALLLNSTPLIVAPLGTIPRVFGAILLAPVAIYLGWAARARRPLVIRGWAFPPPRPWLAVAQVVVSTVDWIVAGLVLFVLLPTAPGLTLPGVLTAFLAAQLAGLASHVPGGLSVFEWCMDKLFQPY
jgi:phosphatidylglycerol lysyltransferase